MLTIELKGAPPDVVVLQLAGRLTLGAACQQLVQQFDELIRQNKAKFVLEMAGLEFMDSAGLGSVVACFGKAKKAGGDLRIAAAQKKVSDTFKITHVDAIVKLFPSAQAAAESFLTSSSSSQPSA